MSAYFPAQVISVRIAASLWVATLSSVSGRNWPSLLSAPITLVSLLTSLFAFFINARSSVSLSEIGASTLFVTDVPYPDFLSLSLEHGAGFVSDSSRNRVAQPYQVVALLSVLFRNQAATYDLRWLRLILYWRRSCLFWILLENATDIHRISELVPNACVACFFSPVSACARLHSRIVHQPQQGA